MIRIITIALILLTLHSCTPTRVLNEFTRPSLREPSKKEMRQQARHERKGQRKLAKLLRSHPELQRDDTIMARVPIITPARSGTIVQPLMIPTPISDQRPIIITERVPGAHPDFSVDFNDSEISARFSLIDGVASLDYTIPEDTTETTATIICPTVQPTQYIPLELSKMQRFWLHSGQIFWAIIVVLIAASFIRKKLNAL